MLEDAEKALDDLFPYVLGNPQDTRCIHSTALLLTSANRLSDFEKLRTAVLEGNPVPESPGKAVDLAKLCLLSDLTAAEADIVDGWLTPVAEKIKDHPVVIETQAMLALRRGNARQAMELFNKARTLYGPRYHDTHSKIRHWLFYLEASKVAKDEQEAKRAKNTILELWNTEYAGSRAPLSVRLEMKGLSRRVHVHLPETPIKSTVEE